MSTTKKMEKPPEAETAPVESQQQQDMWPDFKRMKDVMESIWQRPWSLPLPGPQLSLNMFRDGSDLVVEANMPGVKKEDIKIKVENNNLTIEADHDESTERDDKEHFFREIRRQHFFRRVGLPMEVDEDKTKATYKDGVLQMKFPIMKPDAATPKTIQVE